MPLVIIILLQVLGAITRNTNDDNDGCNEIGAARAKHFSEYFSEF